MIQEIIGSASITGWEVNLPVKRRQCKVQGTQCESIFLLEAEKALGILRAGAESYHSGKGPTA